VESPTGVGEVPIVVSGDVDAVEVFSEALLAIGGRVGESWSRPPPQLTDPRHAITIRTIVTTLVARMVAIVP
jgi:hypothetical protein